MEEKLNNQNINEDPDLVSDDPDLLFDDPDQAPAGDNDLLPEGDNDLILGGDNDLMPIDNDLDLSAADNGEALPSEDAPKTDSDITDEAFAEETGLNKSAEFLRKFADSFSEEFVIDLPSSKGVKDIVQKAIADAYATSEDRLKAQISKETNRRQALESKLAELRKLQ